MSENGDKMVNESGIKKYEIGINKCVYLEEPIGCKNPKIIELYNELKPESVLNLVEKSYALVDATNCSTCKYHSTGKNGNLLTTKEVANLLHIHVNTARRWADEGILKSYRIGKRGDRRFIKSEVLEAALDQKSVEPAHYLK